MFILEQNQIQRIGIVMIDATGTEVSGLGGALTIEISKNGAPYVAGVGVQGEIGSGGYYYDLTAAETNTIGILMVKITGVGCVQQNNEYVVYERTIAAIDFTYTVTNSVTLLPIADADVYISSDLPGLVNIWVGKTDAAGVARDIYSNLPRLDPGTYYFWTYKAGISFPNPDTEVVS